MSSIDTASGYRAARIMSTQEGDQFFFHMSISGGGARAAALGLGVMEALRDTRITWQGREESLLDELDMLTAVSGGSMLAGWYALHGQPGLATFEQLFFANPLQDGLLSFALSPRSLWRIQSPRFGRGDLFSEYLDEKLFKGATFGDLSRDPHKPFVTMYASDMVTGARFEFVQDQFDLLCSDLDTVKIARAVAASSAAPIVFSPLTFWNYASLTGRLDCAGRPLPVKSVLPLPGGLLHVSGKGGRVRPFIHLIDGGLSDNVGARGPLEHVARYGSVIEASRQVGYRGIKHALFVVVNAETSARAEGDDSADVPGPLRAAFALADIPINQNSAAALAQARSTMEAWRAEVTAAHQRGDYEVFAQGAQIHLVEVTLADERDLLLRKRLMSIPTNLHLPADDLAALRAYARESLARSDGFKQLMHALDSQRAPGSEQGSERNTH